MPTPPPPVLYKYYSAARIHILDDMWIRFTQPSEFNDRFDSDFLISASKPRVRSTRAEFLASHGAFCMTTDPNNQLMWVHYAGQHTGFVVGFNTSDRVFSDDDATLDKVLYNDDDLPTIPPGVDPPLAVFFDKSKAWEYEDEWRCVRRFDPKESRDVIFFGDAVHEIILGSHMERNDISRLRGSLTYTTRMGTL